jgi:CheY-like chemotaxis protein
MSIATILLVEENPITRKLVRSALEANDIAVREAEDGSTALRLLAMEPSDLVLQDLVLPDMDGFSLAARLRALPGGAEMPILAVSGFLSKPDEARVSAVGFNDVITKPVEPSRLWQIVRAHLPDSSHYEMAFGKGRRLLVVDDDPVQRKLLCFRLNRLGFETPAAADGVEALEMARCQRPDAIVADVMMPRLDGFGLCVAVRRDVALSGTPLILVTNSYIEDADRELATAAGASEFVVRTPEMREVVDAVRTSLALANQPTATPPPPNLQEAWGRRVMSQLDRQVSLNAGIAQRCATLSAELSVLSSISHALANRQDIETALADVLAACFDAGGISSGALCLFHGDSARFRKLGSWGVSADEDIDALFRQSGLLREVVDVGRTVRIPGDPGTQQAALLLGRAGIATAIVVPLVRGSERVGALLMGSRTEGLQQEDRIAFTEGVATQISQALTLAQAFEQKEASERRFQEQAAVLRSVLESTAEGVVVANADGKYLVWNSAAEAILARGPEDVPPIAWGEHYGLLRPSTMCSVPGEALPLVRAMRGEAVDSTELYVRESKPPRGSYISCSARPLKDASGAPNGGVAVFRDVTAEKASQAQLMVADRMVSVGMLAAGIAHEINNPMAAVLGNLDLVIDQLRDSGCESSMSEQKAALEALCDAREAADKVRQIVRDLKVFSRTDEERTAAVDIHRVLESSLRMAWNEVRHRARVTRAYGDVPLVDGNESRLGQVFLNLIVNAAQAIPDGNAAENEIRLATRSDNDGRVVVDIGDTGAGISPDAMKRLFTPFFTTKPIGAGTGLGLSICHRLVSAIGGEITVDSNLGKGTVFHVALPASAIKDLGPSRPSASVRQPTLPRKGRVLVIDDESAILNLILRVMGEDHECVASRQGAEALARIQNGERFDVILCDLMMPVMTGMEVFSQLTLISPEQAERVVFLTGGAFTSQASAFLASVANQRLEKPFEIATLKAMINSRLA